MTREEFERRESSLIEEMLQLREELNQNKRKQDLLRKQYVAEYEPKIPYGTKIKLSGYIVNSLTGDRTYAEYILFIGEYKFIGDFKPELSNEDEELVKPVLYKPNKSGAMGKMIFSTRLKDINYEIIEEY